MYTVLALSFAVVPVNVSFVTREQWEAENETGDSPTLYNPIATVIVHHTNSEMCFNLTGCTIQVRSVSPPSALSQSLIPVWDQAGKLGNLLDELGVVSQQLGKLQRLAFRNGMSDIEYNFLVGGDGRVYEGRGWRTAGGHTFNWNSRSLGVALVGTFTYEAPADEQLASLALLLEWGVQHGRVHAQFKLAGKCQLKRDPSPGARVMVRIRRWEHWWDYTEGDHSCG